MNRRKGLPPRPPKTSNTPTTTSYLSHGTYGCVLKPAVPCVGKTDTPPNSVSKVFNDPDHQREEVEFQNRIARIDPQGEFTIRKFQECEVAASNIPMQVLSKCGNITTASPHFWQIIYEYGGDDLKHLCRRNNDVPFENLFKGMEGIMKGLTLMQSRNAVHQDIKPANILYNRQIGKAFLIDFGLLVDGQNVYGADNEYVVVYDYDFYPTEYKMMHGILSSAFGVNDLKDLVKLLSSESQEFEHNVDALRHLINQDAFQFLVRNYLQFHKRCLDGRLKRLMQRRSDAVTAAFARFMYWHPTNLEDLREYILAILDANEQHTYEKLFIPQTSKIDVYMLGITLLEVFVWLEEQGRIDFSNEAFVVEVLHLIHGMIRFNPEKRLSPKQAYAQYRRVLVKMTMGATKVRVLATNKVALERVGAFNPNVATSVRPKSKTTIPKSFYKSASAYSAATSIRTRVATSKK